MKKFYLENMSSIHKFIINQIALSLFGIMITWPVSDKSLTLILIMGCFSSVFFCYMQYDNLWSLGALHRNRVINKRMEYTPLYGLKISLFAYIPSALIVLLCYISRIFPGVTFFDNLYLIMDVIFTFLLNGMYSGFQIALNTVVGDSFATLLPWIFPLFFVPGIAVCALAYYLGVNDKQIKCFFGMKPSTDVVETKGKKK